MVVSMAIVPSSFLVRAGQPDNDKFSSAWGGFAEYGIVKDYKAAMEDQADVKDINLGITQQVCPEGMQAEAAETSGDVNGGNTDNEATEDTDSENGSTVTDNAEEGV